MFHLNSPYPPAGDQPRAIEQLSQGLRLGYDRQVLLGVTGSGKTLTMAGVIAATGRPTLILAHNKTLAAQLYQEMKALFPTHAVEYFVSYYDYYQPEAYIARSDTYIEKDLAINDQIERLRLSATRSLIERQDVIIVSSVSCIYGLGMPEHYIAMKTHLQIGQLIRRDALLLKLVDMQYERSEDPSPGYFRVRGDTIEVGVAYESDTAYRITLWGDEIESISAIDPLTGVVRARINEVVLYPGSHHVTPADVREQALMRISEELDLCSQALREQGRLLEAQRLVERTRYDMEMIGQMGHCKGIENYSRHFSGRAPGQPPACLLSYFPKEFLLFIDESHQTLPQVHAMHNGDRARKAALVEYGFRLPSAFDNRPLKFEEFEQLWHSVIFVSATPGAWELGQARQVVEQIIRPTGLLDPPIEVRSAHHQIDDVVGEIKKAIAAGGRVLVTTLTKKMAQELSDYLEKAAIPARYLHSEIETLERLAILRELRQGQCQVLVGINLLREGLDIPEVTLVAILDADREGFLRSATALIQTCGRAARNSQGRVIMYADRQTPSMRQCIEETQRRRSLQAHYNDLHGIIPKTAQRAGGEISVLEELQSVSKKHKERSRKRSREVDQPPPLQTVESFPKATLEELERAVAAEKQAMQRAASDFQFEQAVIHRDRMHRLQELMLELTPESG